MSGNLRTVTPVAPCASSVAGSNLAAVLAMAGAIRRADDDDLGRFEPVAGAIVRGPTCPRSSSGPLGSTGGPSSPGRIGIAMGVSIGDGGDSSRSCLASVAASCFKTGTAALKHK